MNNVEQLLANMTKDERKQPVTRGDLVEFTAMLLRQMKALQQRIQQLEKEAQP